MGSGGGEEEEKGRGGLIWCALTIGGGASLKDVVGGKDPNGLTRKKKKLSKYSK